MYAKTRRFYAGAVSGQTRATGFSPWENYSNSGPQSVETVHTMNHARLHGGRWSGGGPFRVTRDRTVYSPSPPYALRSGTGNLGKGTIRIEAPTTGLPSLTLPGVLSDSTLDSMATTAIARTEPLNPAFDLSVFIGELRAEGLPNLPGTAVRDKVKLARASGSEYLNIEFGWLPLISGIRDFARTVDQADKILTQHRQLANKVIDRSYEWPAMSDARADACNFSMYPAWGFFTGGGEHQTVWNRQWFEAEYVFYLPTGSGTGDKFARYGSYARKLLGIDLLSPEVLWNLSPWSWAADWFSNAGDVMHNVAALGSDGLVLRNAFIMSHSGRITTRHGTYNGHRMTSVRTQETKIRRVGTPYGFGVDFSSLSRRQVAVIAALGMSRW